MIELPQCRSAIEKLIPHHGAMCLLERVLAFTDDSLHAQTDSHRSPDNPLRRGGGLSALHLCEYGAQAMALHGGLCAARSGQSAPPGLLVSLRGVQLHCERIDEFDGPLDVRISEVGDSGAGWQSSFEISHNDRLLARGRSTVMRRT